MPDSAGGRAAAENATVDVAENPDDAYRRINRLRADVAQCQRVVDELEAGAASMAAKADEVAAIYKAKLRETANMIAAAHKAVKDAETALKAEEG